MSDLAQQLRTETEVLHRAAERTPFMGRMLRGRIDRTEYAAYLASLVPVYGALERREGRDPDPRLAPLLDGALARSDSIAADLEWLVDGAAPPPPTPAALEYARRIEELRAAGSLALAGHSYVRYLGDLSGGQVLQPIIERTLGLPAEATSFYRFPAIGDLTAYKRDYRAALDRLTTTDAEADAVVEEAQRAFRLNIALFDSLGG